MNCIPTLILVLLLTAFGVLMSQDFPAFDEIQGANQVYDDTEAGRFFSHIFEKYDDELLPLSSPWVFVEGHKNDTGEYYLKGSFYKVDSLAQGNARYLREATPAIIDSFSDITIFQGILGTHYELSTDGLVWFGYLHDNDADLIRPTDEGKLDSDFVKHLGEKKIEQKEDKQDFCDALLEILSHNYHPGWSLEKVHEEYIWSNDTLHLNQSYELSNEISSGYPMKLSADFIFEHDRLIGVKNITRK